MVVWKGQTATGVQFISRSNANIAYFIITNLTGGTVTINLKIQRNGANTQVSPLNLQLAQGECYTDRNMVILQDELLILLASGSVNYYFSMPTG